MSKKTNWMRIGDVEVEKCRWDIFRTWKRGEGYVYELRRYRATTGTGIYKRVGNHETTWYYEHHMRLPSSSFLPITRADRMAGYTELGNYVTCLINRERDAGLLRPEQETAAFIKYMETDFYVLRQRMRTTRKEQKKNRKKKRTEEQGSPVQEEVMAY